MNETKGAISLMICGNAEGELLPPFVCYKAEGMFSSWRTGGPKRARYAVSKSGWFESEVFEEWFMSLALPHLKKRAGVKVLLGDNLSSHFSAKVLKVCRENNIRFVCLPPNTTDILQPMDVAFFAPMKRAWRKMLDDYKMDNPNETAVRKDKFPQLLKLLLEILATNGKANLKNGFAKCFSRSRVLQDHPLSAQHTPHEVANNFSKVLLDVLQARRFKKSVRNVTRKRLSVAPGKSIGDAEDSSHSSCESDTTDVPTGCESESEMEVDESASAGLSMLSSGAVATTGSNYPPTSVDGRWFITKFLMGRIYKYFAVLEVDAPSSYGLLNVICQRKNKNGSFYFPRVKDSASIHPDQVQGDLPAPRLTHGAKFVFYHDFGQLILH